MIKKSDLALQGNKNTMATNLRDFEISINLSQTGHPLSRKI